MRRCNFTATALFAGGVAQSCGIGGGGAKPVHQCASAGKDFCFADRGVSSGRGRRGNRTETLRILERAGSGKAPMQGDELPQEWQKQPGRKVANGRDSPSKRAKKKGPLLSSVLVQSRISAPVSTLAAFRE
jgi:hypothetical protein